MIKIATRTQRAIRWMLVANKGIFALSLFGLGVGLALVLLPAAGALPNMSATTLGASNITANSATLNGATSDVGVTARGFQYGTNPSSYSSQTADTNGATYVYASKWGEPGSGNGQFSNPEGIAVDSLGNVYVADVSNNRIQKFSGDGTYITQWGGLGNGDGQFNGLTALAVDSSNNIYTLEGHSSYTSRVQKFSSTGTYITQWGGANGSGNGQFLFPGAIAVDSLSNVYVADSGNGRIQKFTSAGVYITQWGGFTDSLGFTGGPSSIAADSSNNVYAISGDHTSLQKFSSTGTYITQWGIFDAGEGQLGTFMRGLAVDSFGNVFVGENTDTGDVARIQKFTGTGTYIAQFGARGSTDGKFFALISMAIDPSGNVYALDGAATFRVQKFSRQVQTDISGLSCGTTYYYRVYATDGSTTSYGSNASFTTSDCPALSITTESLPDGTVGQDYSTVLEATGAQGGLYWSISGASLPPGLNLYGSSGIIADIPTEEGTYDFIVHVDDGSRGADKIFSITIHPAASVEPLEIITDSIPDGTVGTPYSFGLEAAHAKGALVWSIVAGSLDSGLNLGASSGLISGIPVVTGTYTITVSVTDGVDTASKQFTHYINPLPTTPPPPPGQPPVVDPPSAPRTGGGLFVLLVVAVAVSSGVMYILFSSVRKHDREESSSR